MATSAVRDAAGAPLDSDRSSSPEADRDLSRDLSALTKPRITLMVVLTTLVGYVVATPMFDAVVLANTLIGTALLATGSSVFNQMLERRTDARMQRTRRRPLVTGTLSVTTAAVLGIASSAVGAAWLWLYVNPMTAFLGVLTLVLYVLVYTPLKRWSSVSTIVGAVPGAIPPMMGCTAASGEITGLAWALFGILFLWQMPHFLAIAWLYREDYARGGFPMLPVGDLEGQRTWRQMVFYAAALVPVSLVPSVLGFTGLVYLVGALVVGLGFLWSSIQFGRAPDMHSARRLLVASVLYLPVVLLLMAAGRSLP